MNFAPFSASFWWQICKTRLKYNVPHAHRHRHRHLGEVNLKKKLTNDNDDARIIIISSDSWAKTLQYIFSNTHKRQLCTKIVCQRMTARKGRKRAIRGRTSGINGWTRGINGRSAIRRMRAIRGRVSGFMGRGAFWVTRRSSWGRTSVFRGRTSAKRGILQCADLWKIKPNICSRWNIHVFLMYIH